MSPATAKRDRPTQADRRARTRGALLEAAARGLSRHGYGNLVLGQLYNAAEFLAVQDYTHVQRWAQTIAARPAVQRGRRVNRTWGEAGEQVAERHSASDLD